MQLKDLIIEIGTEEIPARFLQPMFSDLAAKTEKLLAQKRLTSGRIEVFGTMRRIIISATDVPAMQPDAQLKIKGPSKEKAFSKDGTPTKTAQAFAASKGVSLDGLILEKVNNVEYVFAIKDEKGLPSEEVLKTAAAELLSSAYLPISMKWGKGDHSFIRPIHYISAFFGGKPLPCEAAGIVSGEEVPSHRALSEGKKAKFRGKTVEEYKKFLKGLGVIAENRTRKEMIEKNIAGALDHGEKGLSPDPELIAEVSDLVEDPRVLKGMYKRELCGAIPQEVISTVIKKQQKCFPVQGSNTFFIIADGRDFREISAGYEQVVNARLADAKFFYDEDLKHPVSHYVEKTKKITYLEKAGTMMDKTLRMRELCGFIADQLGADGSVAMKARKAAELAKFDLATHLVGEFPSLAGVMGRCYALAAGEDPAVALALMEQYLPAFAGDELPVSIEGAILGLSDRFDTIASCFSAGIVPTGSEDPYALRRSAQGIVAIMLGGNMRLSLSRVLEKAFELSGGEPSLREKASDFILQRFRAVLENDGSGREIAESVLASADIFTDSYCRAFEIKNALSQGWLRDVAVSADRVKRICPREALSPADPSMFVEDEEKKLYASYLSVKDAFRSKADALEHAAALKELAPIAGPLAVFFEKVLVMHEDPGLKRNRLALLSQIRDLFEQYADLSKIPV